MKRKKIKFKFIGIFVSLCVLILGINVTHAGILSTPLILTYNASSTNIKSGDTVKLKWNVLNAASVQILGLEKTEEAALSTKGELEVWPAVTTTYVLIASNKDGTSASRTLTVNVDENNSSTKPRINYFLSLKLSVKAGESAKLWWNTTKASRIEITGIEKAEESALGLTGNIEVWPETTTTYILNAFGKDGSVTSKSFTINVTGAKTTAKPTASPTKTATPVKTKSPTVTSNAPVMTTAPMNSTSPTGTVAPVKTPTKTKTKTTN